jgi:uncharacterized membrane protein YkoI
MTLQGETTVSQKNNQDGFAHLLIPLLAVVIIGVGAAGVYVSKHQAKKTLNSQNDTNKISLSAPLPADLLPVDKVKELATTQKPTSAITGVELQKEEGVFVYKVKLADGTVLSFNAKTGEKVTKTGETELNSTKDISSATKPAISFDKAREVALKQKPGGTISKIELELEEGKLVYSARFTDGARVDVSAADGSVVRTKPATKTESKPTPTPSKPGGSSEANDSSSHSSDHKSDTGKPEDSSHSDGSGSSNKGSSKPEDSPSHHTDASRH